MSAEVKKEIELDIAHVLFLDIVGYSKLSINEQRAAVDELTKVVRSSDQYQKAEAVGRLIKIPTGDGMGLVFHTSPEAPVQCAVEISHVLKEHPRLQLRMGVHSGPVSGVIDVNERANLAGAGLNVAKRVMDCGDAGHILVSKHVAEDLEEYEQWRPLLHDVGVCEVKHGVRITIVNLYADEVGNPQLPKKFQAQKKHGARIRWAATTAALLALAAVVAGIAIFSRYRVRSPLAALEKSIAVLPFENRSEDKANAYFADGVQDEILTRLSKIADLKVISRTSVLLYKSGNPRNLREIGQQLGVAHLLEGSVQRAADRIRVNAQLVDARTDAHLWAQSYDRDLANVFAIQSEIAQAIADQLQAKLSPNEKLAIEGKPTTDFTAFDLYARARKLVGADAGPPLLEAVDLLNQAVARDPSFVQAYWQLASIHDRLYLSGLDHTPARLALTEAASEAASRLRPDAGETHLYQAQHLYTQHDYDSALAELEIAAQKLPNNASVAALKGYIQRRQGRWEESTRNLERAAELDPRETNRLRQLVLSYEEVRDYAKQISLLERALAIEPDNIDLKLARAGVELDWKADIRPLHQLIDEIRAKNLAAVPSIAGAWLSCALAERDAAAAKDALIALGENPLNDNAIQFTRPFTEGVIARMTNDEHKAQLAFTAARAEQEKRVQAQPDYGPPLCVLGLIDAALGRKEEALREGRRAVELLPVEKDAANGQRLLNYLAMIAAWVGEKDLACEQFAIAARYPLNLSYGALKLDPLWDPLRGEPCFEKIVASIAPKN